MYKLLDEIKEPKDIKEYSIKDLTRLSVEIRDFLLKSISTTGGHLASNLGVVELTIALHYTFDSPKDKLIWDVGHQCYTHKLLTGRKDGFKNLRALDGMSGFIKRNESEHDIFQAGHSSTSISAAIGMAKARNINNEDHHILPIIGDGAMTGGMAFEAMNYLGHSKEKVIIVLNDNGMSIDKNVGALAKALANLRSSSAYDTVKKDTKFILEKVPKIGEKIEDKLSKVKNSLKYMLLPNMLFEELGFTYVGPIDGHNISQLVETLKKSKKIKGPVLIHTITQKGKGYLPAERMPENFHGVGQFDPFIEANNNKKSVIKYSHVFGRKILDLAKENKDIFAITAAMPSGTGLLPFKKELPERYIDVGIAEQNATTVAAGLAAVGKKPFFAVYSTFLQRAYDQVLHDVCIQNLPVVFCIDRAGIVGQDGETHHGVFDLSYLLSIPNMMVLAPKDGYELERMISFAVNYKEGPIAIRYPRGEATQINESRQLITNYEILRQGKDLCILAVGNMVEKALNVADQLIEKDTLSIKVINMRKIKPIEFEKLKNEIGSINKIVTIEDNVLIGGFGSMISQNFNNQFNLLNIGFKDEFVEHGDTKALFKKHGLSKESIYNQIKEFLG